MDFRVITTSKQTLVTLTYPGRRLKNPLCPIVALGLTVVQVEISNLTCTCYSSKEGKIDLEILFADVLDRNKGFPDQTNVHNYYRIAILTIERKIERKVFQSKKNVCYRVVIVVIFPKGLIHHRGQTSKSLFLFFIAGISFTS